MKKTLKEIFETDIRFDENILSAFEKGKLIFFIGAGVSRIMGIPGWGDFSARLIRKAFPDYKEQNTILKEISDCKERITIAYKKFEQDDRLEKFYEEFGKAMQPDPGVFAAKKNIYEILNRFDAFFLTTNADNLFEEVLGSALCHEDYNTSILKNEHNRRQNHLFYLHGHYTDGIDIKNNNLVFTAPQYVTRYNDGKFIEFLEWIFAKNNTIIFVGYGLNEFELIDYIVTKVHHDEEAGRKVYLLYGFCDNEDILYEAKKSYFEALNIEMIPYDIGKMGYDSLIYVLEALNRDYNKKVIVPVTDTISKCIQELNDENYATIKRFLKNEELAHTNEVQIAREIIRCGGYDWVIRLYNDGLFSPAQLDKKAEYRAWPLLEIFASWVESDDEQAQVAAVGFLNSITTEQINNLAKSYTSINKYIIQIVFALKADHAKAKYLDLIRKIVGNNNLFFYEFSRIESFERVAHWDKRLLKRLFDNVFAKTDFDSFGDSQLYAVNQLMNRFNALISDKKIATFLFKYFRDVVFSESKKNYNLFLRIHDLDNIYKNHQDYWKLAIGEIKLSFSQFNKKVQHKHIVSLISGSDIAGCKLGLYLARKFDQDISEFLSSETLFADYGLFHEYFLNIRYHSEKGYLTDHIEEEITKVICASKFGIDKYNVPSEKEREYYNNLILSKRMALLQHLKNKTSKREYDKLLKEGGTPYESVQIADDCDYVHSMTWTNEIKITRDTFRGIPYENWCDKLVMESEKTSNTFSLLDCGRQFARVVFELTATQFDCAIKSLNALPEMLFLGTMNEFRSNLERIVSKRVLVDVLLDYLKSLVETKTKHRRIAKEIFDHLATVEISEETMAKHMLEATIPWIAVSIEESQSPSGESHILTDLINNGDFYKITVLINSFVALRKLNSYSLSENDVELIEKTLAANDTNQIVKYSLCYHYQNLKYIGAKNFERLFETLLGEKVFDIKALLFCILNSGYVFAELTELVERHYLNEIPFIPEDCQNSALQERLYSYIISARNYGQLSLPTFEKAYKDERFLEHFLRCISIWAERDDFVLDDWLIPCWRYIKNNCEVQKQQKLGELLMHSLEYIVDPTEALLDMYLDVVSCFGDRTHLYLTITNCLKFFETNATKAKEFILKIYALDGYFPVDHLKAILSKFNAFDFGRDARTLLNMLTEKGEISNAQKEELVKILE